MPSRQPVMVFPEMRCPPPLGLALLDLNQMQLAPEPSLLPTLRQVMVLLVILIPEPPYQDATPALYWAPWLATQLKSVIVFWSIVMLLCRCDALPPSGPSIYMAPSVVLRRPKPRIVESLAPATRTSIAWAL